MSAKEAIGISALTAALLTACAGESDESADPTARGEKIYRNICTVCHNADPGLDGAIGPAVANASRELLEAKLLRGEYPSGYTPKRETKQMPRFEYLEPNLEAIEAYLARPAS